MSFCKSANKKIKELLKEFDSYIIAHIDTALKITTAIQKALKSPGAIIATALIPGDIDNTARQELIKILQIVVPTLSIVDTCKGQTTFQSLMQCFVLNLKKQDPELQQAILQKLAALITNKLDNSKLDQNLYDLFVQAQYSIKK